MPIDESSEFPVVGNPLVDLELAESELTEQEKTVLWANQVLEEYNSLPKANARERKVPTNLIAQTAKRLVQKPEDIDIAGSVWKSREPAQETKKPTDSFYEEVKKESAKAMGKNWKYVSPEQLALLVKTYANSVLTQDFAHDLLASYFKGPNSRRQRVDAFYNFVFGAVDLAEDQKALKEVVKISNYDTDILPRNSNFLIEEVLLMRLPYPDEEEMLKKVLITNNVIFQLSRGLLDLEELTEIGRGTSGFLKENDKFQLMREQRIDRAIKELGYEEARRRRDVMNNYMVNGQNGRYRTAKDIERIKNIWPTSLTFDENDSLNQKLFKTVGQKLHFEALKPNINRMLGQYGIEDVASFSVISPEGFMLDVFIPASLIAQKGEIVPYALAIRFPQDDIDELRNPELSIFHTSIKIQGRFFKGDPILATLRKASGIESDQHPLQSLELIGFPQPRVGDGQELPAANQQLADEIRTTQLRFLNRRGVKVPLGRTMLSDFGYSSIDFHKDVDDPEKTLVKIYVGNTPYSVKLDRYLNFDFEGKKFNAPFIQDSLRYTILSYLKPILCDETVKNAKGEDRNLDAEVVSRMGHLMLLPSDRHRSVQAIVNCFRIEGKDLIAMDAERREMRRKTGNRVPEDREYTYRRPVIEKEENLPPIEIHLPHVVKFSH